MASADSHAGFTPPARHYRPDIDGLRAIAIAAVVLFHYEVPGFSGGFVGVDIFFVISGYLITSLIAADIENKTFSILAFYERRIRRILPAFLFMLAVAWTMCLIVVYPMDIRPMTSTLIASVAFLANVQLARSAVQYFYNYFSNPFMHTWTLSVEEQFYVFYPLFLFVVARYCGRRFVTALTLVAVAGAAFSVAATHADGIFAFYSATTRLWEFIIGGLSVFLRSRVTMNSAVMRNAVTLAGLGLIAIAVGAFSSAVPFPGIAAAVPCIGTAAIIVAGHSGPSWVARLLSTGLFVRLGLISYSLYLWHWPILVLTQYARTPLPLDAGTKLFLIAVCIGVAYLSWRFVEAPFRGRGALLNRSRLFAAAFAGSLVILLAGFWVRTHMDALFVLQGPQVRQTMDGVSDAVTNISGCLSTSLDQIKTRALCPLGKAGTSRTDFMVWGDSHGAAISPGIGAAAARHGKSGYFIGAGGCPPLLGVNAPAPGLAYSCRNTNAAALERIKALRPHTVFLVAAWPYYVDPIHFSNEAKPVLLNDAQTIIGSLAANPAIFRFGLERTLTALEALNIRVVVVEDVPIMPYLVARSVANAQRWGITLPPATDRAAHDATQANVRGILGELRPRHPFTRIDPSVLMCPVERCILQKNGNPLYLDENHISAYGAQALSGLFDDALAD